jgi:hypothetical protein
VDEEVGWLDITMDDAFLVDLFETVTNLSEDIPYL